MFDFSSDIYFDFLKATSFWSFGLYYSKRSPFAFTFNSRMYTLLNQDTKTFVGLSSETKIDGFITNFCIFLGT